MQGQGPSDINPSLFASLIFTELLNHSLYNYASTLRQFQDCPKILSYDTSLTCWFRFWKGRPFATYVARVHDFVVKTPLPICLREMNNRGLGKLGRFYGKFN